MQHYSHKRHGDTRFPVAFALLDELFETEQKAWRALSFLNTAIPEKWMPYVWSLLGYRNGNSMKNAAPSPAWLSTRSVPPCPLVIMS